MSYSIYTYFMFTQPVSSGWNYFGCSAAGLTIAKKSNLPKISHLASFVEIHKSACIFRNHRYRCESYRSMPYELLTRVSRCRIPMYFKDSSVHSVLLQSCSGLFLLPVFIESLPLEAQMLLIVGSCVFSSVNITFAALRRSPQ